MNNQEIADTLYLSKGTVKNYVSSLLFKLKARDRVALVLYALKAGIKGW
jgi:DNA-binding NarL/FixJ family response regulator